MKSDGFIRVGVRMKRRKQGKPMLGRDTEVYDVDTSKVLPAIGAAIIIEAHDVITVAVRLDVTDMEVVDED